MGERVADAGTLKPASGGQLREAFVERGVTLRGTIAAAARRVAPQAVHDSVRRARLPQVNRGARFRHRLVSSMPDHYENFPVASWLLPPALRPPVRAIYRFARYADDVADEGDATPEQRLQRLAALDADLDAIATGRPTEWPDLAGAVREHDLSVDLLRDLLSAFRQDVTTSRYADYDALLDYCRRSANPVGRLLLALFRCTDPQALTQSDAICTALQLVNFWQDLAIDWGKRRIYLPQSELLGAGLDEAALGAAAAFATSAAFVDRRWRTLMAAQTARACALMQQGAPLVHRLGGRIGWELRLVVQGGLQIARRIDAVGGDVFRHRPTLGPADWVLMFARAAAM